MIIDVRLQQLTSSGGDPLSFPRAGVTCIVGSNNVGKSRLLRELDAALSGQYVGAATFTDLQFEKPEIDENTAERFLEAVGTRVEKQDGQPQHWFPQSGGQQFTVRDFAAHYRSEARGLRGVKPFFAWHASAGTLAGPASGAIGPPGMGAGGQPLVKLFQDGDLEAQLSSLSEQTFGVPLTLDRISGEVRLRVGRPGTPAPPLDHPTRAYADAVGALPALEQQGDGLRSFLGLALTVIAGTQQILLIDEPEAFLHPGQARALGRWLARAAVQRDLQLVLATHDRDLLLGLIDAEAPAVVNIARISREGDVNHIRSVSPAQVAATWNDAVLKYSNVLQGLFHSRAVISESDADCRFYRAVLDTVAAEAGRRAIADDTLFVPSGGKARVASMAKVLSDLGVETYAIVDFDVMRTRSDVIAILESVGGSWSPEMNADYVKMADAINGARLWDHVKKLGTAGVPAGEANASAVSLLERLRLQRMLVVPVGEMEDFDKSIGLEKAAWVSEMLSRGGHKSCGAARALLETVAA